MNLLLNFSTLLKSPNDKAIPRNDNPIPANDNFNPPNDSLSPLGGVDVPVLEQRKAINLAKTPVNFGEIILNPKKPHRITRWCASFQVDPLGQKPAQAAEITMKSEVSSFHDTRKQRRVREKSFPPPKSSYR